MKLMQSIIFTIVNAKIKKKKNIKKKKYQQKNIELQNRLISKQSFIY